MLTEKSIQNDPINYFSSVTQLGANLYSLAQDNICLNPIHRLSVEHMLTSLGEQIFRDRKLSQDISLPYSYSYRIPPKDELIAKSYA